MGYFASNFVSASPALGGVEDAGATMGLDYGTTANFYVDGSVASSGNGLSVGAAKKTIQEAITLAQAANGGTIAVRAGTYREKVSLGSTAYSGGLYLKPYSTETPKITGANLVTGWAACTSGDSTLLGSAWVNCYKATISAASLASGIGPLEINIHEAGEKLGICHDSALPLDPVFPGQESQYHTADVFTVDGSSYINGITDVSVFSAYTSAQILNMSVMLYHFAVAISQYNIDSYTSGTNTANITTDKTIQSISGSPKYWYALLNALPNIKQGQWGIDKTASGGNYTVYLWPNNAANLTAGIEYSVRDNVIDLGTATGEIKIEGFTIVQSAGSGTTSGAVVSHPNGANSNTRRGPVILRHNTIGNQWTAQSGYGAVFCLNADDCVIENNDIQYCGNSFGIFMACCSDSSVSKNYFYKTATAGIRYYGGGNRSGIWSERVQVAFNDFHICGRNAHSNLLNFYEGCDTILVYGNRFVDSAGYLTWQEASNLFIAFNEVPIDKYDDITARSIVDQNHGSDAEPDETSPVSYLWNNRMVPRAGLESTWRNSLQLGVSMKTARVCATSNITLSGPQTIDGVSVIAGDRVLVAGQTTQTQNGIYVCAAGAWSRATDSDGPFDILPREWVKVTAGTSNSGTWRCAVLVDYIDLGVTNITYAKQTPQRYGFYNNIIHGGGVDLASYPEQQIDTKNNLFTIYASGWAQGADDLDPTDYYDNVMINTYVDTASEDYTYTPGGNAGRAGNSVATARAAAAAAFPTFDFNQDMYGRPVDWTSPFIGPFDPRFRI